MLTVVPLGFLVFAALTLVKVAGIPYLDSNAARLAPSIALAKGYSVYYGPNEGPILDYMYGPVAAIAFLPAALVSSPSPALLIAGGINILAFFGPMAWLHFGMRGARPMIIPTVCFLCFTLLVFYDVGLVYSAFNIHADAPALGLAGCASAFLIHRKGTGTDPPLFLSATCAVLAVWTKQTAAPIVLALPVYLLVADGSRSAVRYCLRLGFMGALAALLFVLVFGYRDMVFNMFTIPGQVPWYGQAEGGKMAGALTSMEHLLRQNGWPLALIALAALLDRRPWTGFRPWLANNPWTLPAMVGLFMVPTSVVGGAKVGGFLNAHSMTNYFLLGAATLSVGQTATNWDTAAKRRVRTLLSVFLLVLAMGQVTRPGTYQAFTTALSRLRSWSDNPQQRAYEFARKHPEEVYFASNPLPALLAEGRLYHSEIGVFDRELAGLETSEEHLRAHRPRKMRLVAAREKNQRSPLLPEFTDQLPGFEETTPIEELSGWVVYERASGSARDAHDGEPDGQIGVHQHPSL